MPIPNPKKEDNKQSFIGRCMESEVMQSEFPDKQQRLAVCFSQWKKGASKARKIVVTENNEFISN